MMGKSFCQDKFSQKGAQGNKPEHEHEQYDGKSKWNQRNADEGKYQQHKERSDHQGAQNTPEK